MKREYIITFKLKAKVVSDCPMRACDKVARWVVGGGRRKPPFEVVDWGFLGVGSAEGRRT